MTKRKKRHRNAGVKAESAEAAPAIDEAPRAKGIIAFLNRYGLIILCVFVLVYVAMYGYTSYRKYDSFSYYDFDLAIYNQVTWNTVHGKFLYSTIRENLYNMDGIERRVGIYFKDHVPTQPESHAKLEQYLSNRGFTLDEEWRLNVFRVTE